MSSSTVRRAVLAACCALLLSAGAASTASAGTVGQTGRVNNAQGQEVCKQIGAFFKTGSVCARLVASFSWDFNKVVSKRRVFSTSYRIQTRTTGVGSLYRLKTSKCSGHYAGPPISPQNRYTWNCRVVFSLSQGGFGVDAPVDLPAGDAFASGSFVG